MTRLIADENIPQETVELLRKQGVDIIPVTSFELGLSDVKILDMANREGRIVVTFDTDFGRLVFKEKKKITGLLLLRFTPKSPQQIAGRIKQVLATNIKLECCVVTVRKDSLKVTPVK